MNATSESVANSWNFFPHQLDDLYRRYSCLDGLAGPFEPLLCVPFPIIAYFRNKSKRLPHFMKNADAEEAFTETVTERHSGVAYYQWTESAGPLRGRCVRSSMVDLNMFRESDKAPILEDLRASFRATFGRDLPAKALLRTVDKYASSHKKLQRALAAALLTYEEFQRDLTELRGWWARLPGVERGVYFGIRQCPSTIEIDNQDLTTVNTWRNRQSEFLHKYCLQALPSFDLPEPLPLVQTPGPLPADHCAMPRSCATTYAHPCVNFTSEEAELLDTLQYSVQQTNPIHMRLRKAADQREKYARYFDVLFIMKAVKQRCSGSRLPHGGLTEVVDAMAAYFQVDTRNIYVIMKEIKALRQQPDSKRSA